MKYQIDLNIHFTVKMELTEKEALALRAIAGYGHEAFIKVFKEHMGQHYISEGEQTIPELFNKFNNLQSSIDRIREAKKLLGEMADVGGI
jgi:ATP-dependent 26S proteasome regulatory subunit